MNDNQRMVQGGPDLKLSTGQRSNVDRIGPQNDAIFSQLHGAMYEQARQQNMFFAASQAATTTSVALHTTHTGFCLSNPAGNSKNLIPRLFGANISVSPAALSTIGLGGGYAAAGVATHTTPLTTYSTVLGSETGATGLADGAATLVGTPVLIHTFATLDDSADIGFGPCVLIDLQGSIIIPPGAYVCVYTLTAVVGFFSMTWEEIPR